MDTQAGMGVPKLLILIIGVVIGLLLAGAIVLVKSGLLPEEGSTTTVETKAVVLTIDSPADGDVSSTDSLKVVGSTGKDTVVVVAGGAQEQIVETKDGKFDTSVKLAEGENTLTIYAFDTASGESAQTSLSVVYLKDEFAARNVLVASSHTDVIEKNKQRVEEIKEKLATQSANKGASVFKRAHVFGTITATADSSLTVETVKSGLKTIFTDEFTKFFSVDSKGRSTIKFEDLKVGDRVSAIGVGKDDTSGEAKFIIRQNQVAAKRHALLGKVKEADGAALTLTHLVQADREFAVNIASGATIKIKGREEASVTDIKADDVVVAVGAVASDGTLSATRLFVVPGRFEGTEPKESTTSATPSANQ